LQIPPADIRKMISENAAKLLNLTLN
jgi:hypothetical protein